MRTAPNSYIVLLCLALLSGTVHSVEVVSGQVYTDSTGQIEQMLSDRHVIYRPRGRVKIRKNPSLHAKQIGLLNEENMDWYVYKTHNEDWLRVSKVGEGPVGYSHKSAFTVNDVVVLEDYIYYAGSSYQLKFIGYALPQDGSYYTYRTRDYFYEIFQDGSLIFTKGRRKIRELLAGRAEKKSREALHSQFHALTINGKKVGWLFGWNKYQSYGPYSLDFSFARLLIPAHTDSAAPGLYTTSIEGLKQSAVADLLDRNDNELLITPTEVEGNLFSCGACLGYYYTPKLIKITRHESQTVSVTASDVPITDRLIEADPGYAYAIAFNQDDTQGMRKAFDVLKPKLIGVEKSCSEYDIPLDGTIGPSWRWGAHVMRSHWKKVREMRGNSHIEDDAHDCVKPLLTDGLDWHLFIRTGLFPSISTIEGYINRIELQRAASASAGMMAFEGEWNGADRVSHSIYGKMTIADDVISWDSWEPDNPYNGPCTTSYRLLSTDTAGYPKEVITQLSDHEFERYTIEVFPTYCADMKYMQISLPRNGKKEARIAVYDEDHLSGKHFFLR